MFSKPFVSLVFSSNRLYVLQLDAQKKKVKYSGSFELLAGMIVNRHVKDPVALGELIRKSIVSLGVKEKSVGLVVPEFSTYTKSLKLPELDIDELDEAVAWQSRDFLPNGGEGMVMDWQIIGKDADGYRVLAAAIRQDVLAGYIDAASKAGLYPLVVETPSLSLIRVAARDESRKLILYVSADETVVVMVQGESIIASSVASSSSQNEIVQTAARMMGHYADAKVAKVLLGGAGLSQQFIEALQNNLKVPVELLDKKIDGLDRAQIQEYLVSVSLQLKDPVGPDDVRTINLLPPGWEKHYLDLMRNMRLWTLTLVTSIVVWASFLVVLVVYMVMMREAQNLSDAVQLSSETEAEELYVEIEEINSMATRVGSVADEAMGPVELVNLVAAAKVGGIRVDDYLVNMERGSMVIVGKAAGRGALLDFKRLLEERAEFIEVELPISSLIGEGELDFEVGVVFSEIENKVVPKLQI